ncbi:hypothetical protein Cch01nite_05660 [Cellulomonas chitinilytica]|uniref:Uncharacterized protein n=1 Tax=Cellulomonas chitinilytica TaxID=398759 RepID=A0A919NYG3_9CELL|nr:hypothetical protein Cch01nite_05660 [Cellulomonas chitinilytica]
MSAAAVSALCGLLLAGCTATAGPQSADTAPASTTSAASTSPTSTPTPTSQDVAAVDLTVFRSDSTTCQFDAPDSALPGIGCQMNAAYTYEIPEAWLDYGVDCADISLGYDAAEGELGCASDVSYEDAYATDPLPAGSVVRHGGMTCTILEVGITCTNAVGGVMTITPDHYLAHAG